MTHHLMIIHRRYIVPLTKGKKTIECRLARIRTPPYGCVARRDTLWLKVSGGPVVARATVRHVDHIHPLTPSTLYDIRKRYGSSIVADDDFYFAHADASFATLITLGRVVRLVPFQIAKRDRRAWVVLSEPPSPAGRTRRSSPKPQRNIADTRP